MKMISKRITTLFLAILILFSSSGFGLVEHSCVMWSKKSYSIVAKDTCKGCDKHNNKHEGKTFIKKPKCCENKQIIKENKSASIVNIVSKFLKPTSDSINKVLIVEAKFTKVILPETENITTNQNEPLNHCGKKLLFAICQLRL